ncbi:MAG: (Fe-S)-binding protein [Candidatus Eisenbacteria sp.]|nr:(Fe-S)-binding protein [Candidatus Eisenbacteria bacterium]
MSIEKVIEETRAYYCLECGVCTASCPISRLNPRYSPRLFVERSLLLPPDRVVRDKDLWACLTCGTCSSRCPSGVDYPEFMRATRQMAFDLDLEPTPTHGGVLKALVDLQTRGLPQKRTTWIPGDVRIRKTGDVLFFVGCLPHYQVVFRHLEFDGLGSAAAALRLLNQIGIEPVVRDDERCCGHDAYWTGDLETFETVARLNLEMIRASGAKRVVFTCPEGYHTMKEIYPRFLGSLPFEPVHLLELLLEEVERETIRLGEIPLKATFQDPCRLGRLMGMYDLPRQLLSLVPGLEILEMPRNRENALCCGSSEWVHCTACNKAIQIDRLREARTTGADVLITACPKCRIHLSCALKDGDLENPVVLKDLTELLAESAGGENLG